MKLLHSADWHLDSPILGRTPEQTAMLKQALLDIPRQVVSAARDRGCQMLLLSGDLFDGPCSPESLRALRDALDEAAMPVFIAPGNHDPMAPGSPWQQTVWPEHVHIFRREAIESVALPQLNCRVFGGAFTGPEAPALLEGFRAEGDEVWRIGVLHGDPTVAGSPYCPISSRQIRDSGLSYLALGHIHKGGQLRCGDTLCAWPGCPMGRGFDEPGKRGVLIVTLEPDRQEAHFLALDTPRFYLLDCPVEEDPAQALAQALPAAGSRDLYRVTLTGSCTPFDPEVLKRQFPQFPNLELRDRTQPPVDLWAGAGEDSLEGVYFQLLREAADSPDPDIRRQAQLAARISRQLLEGQEVVLP